jgi:hypothetical protein
MRKLLAALTVLALGPSLHAADLLAAPPRTYRVPYRLTNTNHVLVRVKLNGKGPFNFILDTGAPTVFVTRAVGRQLACEEKGWCSLDRLEVEGRVVLKKINARSEDLLQLDGMNRLGLAGVELHGILGYSVLARFRLEFDFTRSKMGWTPLDFTPPPPQLLGGSSAAGMDGLGNLVKMLSTMVSKKPPQISLRGFLGVALEDAEKTVRVKAVLAESPAASAGLQVGDRISLFQGKPVDSAAAVHRLAEHLAPDETVELRIARKELVQTIRIKAGRGL